MKTGVSRRWSGLGALMPITLVLLYVSSVLRVAALWHHVFLLAISIVIPSAALLWGEKHPDLMESEGVDAHAEEKVLRAEGNDGGR